MTKEIILEQIENIQTQVEHGEVLYSPEEFEELLKEIHLLVKDLKKYHKRVVSEENEE